MKHTGLQFLLPYMRPYYRHLLIGTFYALIGAAASAFSPALLGLAVDEVMAGIRTEVLVLYAVSSAWRVSWRYSATCCAC
ncbi:MAG TPA: hypothetical protein PKA05_20945 [Roseiflexaceae bacterium]|nr:hypothetical protein [Roseiflexaceae bacterium]